MRRFNDLENYAFDSRSVLSLALLLPPVAWWAALFLSLTVSREIAEFLGNGLFQVIVLVVCPVLAAVVGMFSMRKTMKLQWITAFVGVGFAFLSLVASFRNA